MKMIIRPIHPEVEDWFKVFEEKLNKIPVKTTSFHYIKNKDHYLCNFTYFPETNFGNNILKNEIKNKLEKRKVPNVEITIE